MLCRFQQELTSTEMLTWLALKHRMICTFTQDPMEKFTQKDIGSRLVNSLCLDRKDLKEMDWNKSLMKPATQHSLSLMTLHQEQLLTTQERP